MGKSILYIISIIIAGLVLHSCAQETLSDKNILSESPYLAIKVRTDSSAGEDDQIKKIRLVVVTGTDQVLTNTLFAPSAPIDENFRLTAKADFGDCVVYIICNETKELQGKLERVNSGTEIEGIKYSANTLAAPLTMYAKVSNIKITYNEKTQKAEVFQNGVPTDLIEVPVVRTMAKLSFAVIKNIGGGERFSVESLNFQVCQAPLYSELPEGRVYDSKEGWAENVTVEGDGKLTLDGDGSYVEGGYEITPGTDIITAPSIYLPEHLLSDAEDNINCTYLLVEAKCKREGSSAIINAKYRINLGQNAPVDHNLLRNTHYRIYATIKDMGATGIYAEIVPLKEYNTPIVWKTLEGYTIMGECETEHYNNVWNNYSQYSGILKIKKTVNKESKYSDALFRYGSIIPLEAATATGNFSSSNVLWKPDGISTISSWGDLEYLTQDKDVQDEHNLANILKGKGDPCRLVGLTNAEIISGTIDNETWRMPTSEEMKWLINAKSIISKSGGFYSYNYLLTPNTGFRTATGVMTPAKQGGYYWSSTKANAFIFSSSDNTGSINTDDPQKAYAIRCVRSSIFPSHITVGEATIDYKGKKDIPLELPSLYLTPYWKMEAEPPSSDIIFTKGEGTYNENALVTIAAASNPYDTRNFKIKVTGYGLDGVTHTIYTNIRQVALSHAVKLKLVSPSNLTTSGGYIRLPKETARLGFQIEVSPELKPPYDASNVGEWRVNVDYYDSSNHLIAGEVAPINGISYIDIPENTFGHLVVLYFEMKPVDKNKFPPYTSDRLILIHEK